MSKIFKSIMIAFSSLLLIAITNCASDNDATSNQYEMSADVDGQNIKIDGYFSMSYNYDWGYHLATIYTSLGHDLSYSMGIDLRDRPHLGVYNFDNEMSLNSGEALFVIRVRNSTSNKFYYSINGHVDISKFEKNQVEGTFECDVVSETGDTLKITNGKLKNRIGGVSGLEWNGL